jgi:hypothetical protein
VTAPQDRGPLKGSKRSAITRKRKARTPAAVESEQAVDTPERVELDFTSKNGWMARVARGFTKEDVVGLALSTEDRGARNKNNQNYARVETIDLNQKSQRPSVVFY